MKRKLSQIILVAEVLAIIFMHTVKYQDQKRSLAVKSSQNNTVEKQTTSGNGFFVVANMK